MATAIRKPTYRTIPGASPAGTGSGTVPHRPHRPERPEIVYLVREPPTVFPYDDAVIHYNIKGDHHEGIYKGGVFYGFGVSYPETGKIRIAPGYGSIWGRQFELESAHDIDMSALTGVKYCVVYVEVNLKSATNQKAEIKMIYAGAGYPDIDTNDLIIQKQGVARMYLYSFEYEANGHLFSNVQAKFYQFGNGVAERARTMDADGLWNGRTVSDLFYYNADRFKKGNHAQYADLGKGFGDGAWLATGDELQIKKKTDDTDIRSLLCVTKGAFIVDPPVANLSKVGDIPLIRENTYRDFYYSNGGNPIPTGATVVGVIVTGSFNHYVFHYWELWDWLVGWVPASGNTFFKRSGSSFIGYYPGTATSYTRGTKKWRDECGAIFSGHVWNNEVPLYEGTKYNHGKSGTNDGSPHGMGQVSRCLYDRLDGIFVYSSTGSTPNYTPRSGAGVKLQFHDTTTKKPYLRVSCQDDVAFSGYLEFRLLYIKGADRVGKEQTTYPWASLNPSLEGGQQ